jgi:hypothetical protein
MQPRLAILFWYYKSPDVCANKLRLLRLFNPGTHILGLYGGELDEFSSFDSALSPWLDDNWAFPENKDAEWKWRHGDRMIASWFLERGRQFEWDTLVIMQWDMLALAPVKKIFADLHKDELYLPGLRHLEGIESRYWWTKPSTEVYGDYLAFKTWISNLHGKKALPLQVCLFFSAALPRSFLDRYALIPEPELGFLEYKIPAYANIFGNAMRDLPNLPVSWFGDTLPRKRKTLTTAKADILPGTIAAEYLTPRGARMFHPVTVCFPTSRLGIVVWVGREVFRALIRRSRTWVRKGLRDTDSLS